MGGEGRGEEAPRIRSHMTLYKIVCMNVRMHVCMKAMAATLHCTTRLRVPSAGAAAADAVNHVTLRRSRDSVVLQR